MKTLKELETENEQLRALNARLANQLVGMSDRLQESAKQIAADAWDEAAQTHAEQGMGVSGLVNPYSLEATE